MVDSTLDALPSVNSLDDESLIYSANWNGADFDSVKISYLDLSAQVMNEVTLAAALANGNLSGGNQINMESQKIINVLDPTLSQDAATKMYVDNTFSNSGSRKNRLLSGNFAQNPWQNGTSITNSFDDNVLKRCADRWFSIRNSSSSGFGGTVSKVQLPTPNPSVSLNNIALKVTATNTFGMVSTERASLLTRINGLDMGGMEGSGNGFIIFSFSASVSANAVGTYSVSFSHPNGGTDLNYFFPVNLTTTHTFYSFSIPVPPVASANFIQYGSSSSFVIRINLSGGTNYQGAPSTWVANGPTVSASQTNFFDTVNNEFYLTDVSLCKSSNNMVFSSVNSPLYSSYNEALTHCYSYYQKSYPRGVTPGSSNVAGAFYAHSHDFIGSSGPRIMWNGIFSTTMIKVPTLTIFNPENGTPNEWANVASGQEEEAIVQWVNQNGFSIHDDPNIVVDDEAFYIHWVADADN